MPSEKGKVNVECPHCGFIQRESSFAHSTICRKCSGYFVIASQKIETAPRTEKTLLRRLGDQVSGLLGPKGPRIIQCFDCGKKQEVSPSAKSSICPHCSSYIDLQDFYIQSPFSRNVRTRGEFHIAKKGVVSSSKVICGKAIIAGKMRGSLLCDGQTAVRLRDKIPGSIDSEVIIVEKRSEVEFLRPLKCRKLEIKGRVSARVICDGVIHIAKKGYLEGTVFARGITVEKGGQFHGDLTIGTVETSQPELLSDEPDPYGNPASGGGFKILRPFDEGRSATA